MNVVEIIIKAVDKYSKELKKAESGLQRFGKAAGGVGKALKDIGTTAAIVVGSLYAMAKALGWVAQQATRLGRADVADSITKLNSQVQELLDQILSTQLVGGNTVLDAIKGLAEGLSVALREIGVVLEIAASGFRRMAIDGQRAIGVLQEMAGQTITWTKAWRDAATAQENATHQARIGLIWQGQLTETIEAQAAALNKVIKGQKQLNQLSGSAKKGVDLLTLANKKLNDQYNSRKSIEDAIRAGDARALADALHGAGGGGGGGGTPRTSNRTQNKGGSGSGSGGGATAVQVFIGNEAVDSHVRKVVFNSVIKPALKNKGTGGSRKK